MTISNEKKVNKAKARLKERFNGDYSIVGEYKDAETFTDLKHNVCGNIFQSKLHTILRNKGHSGECPFCFRTKNQTFSNFMFKVDRKFPNEFLVTNYTKMTSKCNFKHLVCGTEFTNSPHLFLYKNTKGCPKCAGKIRYTHDYIANEIHNATNREYEVTKTSDKYVNERSRLELIHHKCGNIWKTTRKNFIRNNTRCPKCYNQGNRSKMEEVITRVLNENNIEHEFSFKIDGVKSTRNKLEFDYYIEDLNLLIEFDGKQHFFPRNKTSSHKKFFTQINNDQLKNELIFGYDVNFLRIPFNLKEKEIVSIINEILNNDDNILSSTTIEKFKLYFQDNDNDVIINQEEYYTNIREDYFDLVEYSPS